MALGGYLALLLVPLPIHALDTPPAGQLVVIVTPADGSPVRFDPGSLLAMATIGEKTLDQPIPKVTLPGQKVAPCDSGLGQEEINGNCWAWQGDAKPPCGRLFRRGDKCYAPVAADPKKSVEHL